ncbi:CPBP family intramembrane glutamic endopeptidase [Polyangium mundeleinium]|uniref:CPBP family intramembrane metalloprotease n=1 Tax=Polyangium mundeleinium TaxID=2995306 RepID=A0ABT5ETT4_9BACT|nr:CPBP family intramembrane glutamic endopeptidase [Polyangium mundeleinium]MDC0744864.1 CPBP family intramembrane metalloprotease [Polyangium mundeleinium]
MMAATTPVPASTAPWKPDLKIAALLGVVSALAVAALVPYLVQLMPDKFAKLPVPLPVLVVAQSMQAMVVIGLMSLAGLRMGRRVGLGAPLLQRWINREPLVIAPRPLQAILLGVAAALGVVALSAGIDPFLPPMLHPPAKSGAGESALNGFLASFYGGIVEELQLRLFLMTLMVWLVAVLRKARPSPRVYGIAISIAALLFGVGHLPAAHHVWGLDAVVVVRTVLLNSIAGLAFGWLYWKRGLEMALLAHFSADIVLHVLAPLIAKGA